MQSWLFMLNMAFFQIVLCCFYVGGFLCFCFVVVVVFCLSVVVFKLSLK